MGGIPRRRRAPPPQPPPPPPDRPWPGQGGAEAGAGAEAAAGGKKVTGAGNGTAARRRRRRSLPRQQQADGRLRGTGRHLCVNPGPVSPFPLPPSAATSGAWRLATVCSYIAGGGGKGAGEAGADLSSSLLRHHYLFISSFRLLLPVI